MRLGRLLIAIAILVPRTSTAQSSLADGVQALIRGDYQTAQRILQPLAEASSQPDPVAQFFLATMYESGHGVPGNPIRACGLYLKAARANTAFMTQSLTSADAIRKDIPTLWESCADASVESWSDPPPASVTAAVPDLELNTSTTEGVIAFVRGEYERAVELLKPLAERWPEAGDPIAQFFMAMMYESGRGVPADAMRACTLSGLGVFGGIFSQQSLALFSRIRQSLGTEQFEECVFLQGVGFDHRIRPVTFALESADTISFDTRHTTITYQGKERRVDGLVGAPPGAVFLPIEHTRLLVGPSRSTPRHYIEVFKWIPIQRQGWMLTWSLFEVVRDDLVAVTSEELTTVSTSRPPPDASFDVRGLVQLGVNDSGGPEWTILTGPAPRREGIPSEAERKEVASLERARRTADERVDWKRVFAADRPPTLTYSDADGCGRMLVYGWSLDRAEAISVAVDEDVVPLSSESRFTASLPQPGVNIEVQVYDRPSGSLPFCTDFVAHEVGSRQETWRATSGTVTIELSPRGVRARQPELFRATVRITGADFTNSAGIRVRQTQSIRLTGIVGAIRLTR